MNKFEKVSYNQYAQTKNEYYEKEYEEIKLPKRATKYSAGYDFYAPFNIKLKPGEEIKIPTGIRVYLDDDKFLMCVPRSGLGFKYYARFANTLGIIDSDYAMSENEGHIFIKLRNEGSKDMEIEKGTGMAQGIILKYYVTEDDSSNEIRNGGFGSTTK